MAGRWTLMTTPSLGSIRAVVVETHAAYGTAGIRALENDLARLGYRGPSLTLLTIALGLTPVGL